MIHIYHSNSRELKAKKSLEELLVDLPKSLHRRALRYKREEDAYDFLLGRLLLKKGLENLKLSNTLEDIKFQKNGKPYLESVFFNISHSENQVVCAISTEGSIGIDVEIERKVELESFKAWFTVKEWSDINNTDDPLKKFYWYWTRKESIIKALGLKLSYLNQIEIDINQEHFEENGKQWYLKDIELGSGSITAICSEVKEDIILNVNTVLF